MGIRCGLWDRTVSALVNYSFKVRGFIIKIAAYGPLKVEVVTSFDVFGLVCVILFEFR